MCKYMCGPKFCIFFFFGEQTTLFKAWFAETKVKEDMQVSGVRLQLSRLHGVEPQGQPSCVVADQISALCPDFFFLQIQLSLFNPQIKNKNANQKAGKAHCCS